MARRNDHTRDELRLMALTAAEGLLDSGGSQSLSMRRIAQSIGYTHGTLYLIFDNLDDLIVELNARTLDALIAHLQRSSACVAPAQARATAMAVAYFSFAREHCARWRLIFEHHLQNNTSDKPPAVITERIVNGYELVDAALDINQSDNEPLLGASFWAAVHGITVLALDHKLVGANGMELDPHKVIERTVQVYVTN